MDVGKAFPQLEDVIASLGMKNVQKPGVAACLDTTASNKKQLTRFRGWYSKKQQSGIELLKLKQSWEEYAAKEQNRMPNQLKAAVTSLSVITLKRKVRTSAHVDLPIVGEYFCVINVSPNAYGVKLHEHKEDPPKATIMSQENGGGYILGGELRKRWYHSVGPFVFDKICIRIGFGQNSYAEKYPDTGAF